VELVQKGRIDPVVERLGYKLFGSGLRLALCCWIRSRKVDQFRYSDVAAEFSRQTSNVEEQFERLVALGMIERLIAGKGAALYRRLDSPWWRIIDQATKSLSQETLRSRKAKTAS
jgi:hypothetical protein